MAKNGKPKNKPVKRKAGKGLNAHQAASAQRLARLTYSWRHINYENTNSEETRGEEAHGLGMLMPTTTGKTSLAFQLAVNHPRRWQVIVVLYLNKNGEESHAWTWVTSNEPIVAAGNGIAPLVDAANNAALSEMADDEHCQARAVICAPFDIQHPVHPARLMMACAKKIKLDKAVVSAISEWDESGETMYLTAEEAASM